MSRFLFSLLFLTIVYIARCDQFIYPDKEPCILDSMTAKFNLSISSDMQESVEFDLKGAKVLNGSCAENNSIIIGLDKDELTLSFTRSSQDEVSLTMQYMFDVKNRFPNSNDTGTVTLNAEPLTLGSSNTSYVCHANQSYNFRGNSSDFNYNLDLMLSDVHLQAFNVQAGNYSSEEFECAADQQSTIEPQSSDAPTKTPEAPTESTEKPTEAPSTAMTTSPPTSSEYVVKDGDEACIIMDAAITVEVNYTMADGTTNVVPLIVPSVKEGTNVTGVCGTNDTEVSMILTFGAEGKMRTVNFTFGVENEDQVYIEDLTVTVDLDKDTFPNAKDSKESAENHVHFQLSTSESAFKCNAEEDLSLDQIHVKTTQLEVQAFNVNNNTFSDTVKECDKDKSTSTAKPTVTTTKTPPVTTPLPQPPIETYAVKDGNVTCILLQARIQFDITYMQTGGKPKTVKVNAPNGTKASGKCESDIQELDLEFNNGWKLSLFFHTAAKGLQASDDTKFYLGNMTLTYILTPDFFPDAENKSETITVESNLDKTTYEASQGGSYKCKHDRSIKLNNDVTVHTTDLQYKAFGKDNSTKFTDNGITECTDDSETNSIVPIAVGAALAALVVIVLIAYLIGRRRRNKGYESV